MCLFVFLLDAVFQEKTCMESTWQQLSTEMSDRVADPWRVIGARAGRSGPASSVILWRPDLVLTAAHTIRQNADIHIIPSPGISVRAHLAGRATGADIALLRADQAINTETAEFGDTSAL